MRRGRLRFVHADGSPGAEIARVGLTENVTERTRGLLGRPPLEQDEALWIRPCNSVHSFGMGYPLDLIYLDKQGGVRKIRHNLQPRRVSACLRAHSTLELRAGEAARLQLSTGMHTEWNTDG